MKTAEITTSIEVINGVGQALANKYAKLGIFTVADLLLDFPRTYEDRTRKVFLCEFSTSHVNTICKVLSHDWVFIGGKRTLRLAVDDGSAQAFLVARGRDFMQKALPIGCIVAVWGHFDMWRGILQSWDFEAQRIAWSGEIASFEGQAPFGVVFPVYRLTKGLTQYTRRKVTTNAVSVYAKTVDDEVPEELIKLRSLLKKGDAIRQIHNPRTLDEARAARRALVYEELYLFERKLAQRIVAHRGFIPNLQTAASDLLEADGRKPASRDLADERRQFTESLSPRQRTLAGNLPFELTADQMLCILQMNRDIDKSRRECQAMLSSNSPAQKGVFSMSRLLQGDVGSGKTLVALFACAREVDWGGQVALLCPTELLARQHAQTAAKFLEPLDLRIALLTGSLKAAAKKEVLSSLAEGRTDLVVGTHVLFSTNVSYKQLSLVLIDEQHKFGVAQRESIVNKGRVAQGNVAHASVSHTPDLLMMSATPIPQTLALSVFGDLDISVIKTMPKGRLPVKTYLSVEGNETNVYSAVRRELEKGHQAYFVYPRITDEEGGLFRGMEKSAESMYEVLSAQVFPDFRCALVHGKVEDEKQAGILESFAKGETRILVATSVVEVGVDVPNATCIAVDRSQMFGLAELHQLRGRVGRGKDQSYCFLIYDRNITEIGKERLKTLRESTDGFYIAEQDLKLRGPGEVFGTAQSGYLALNVADLVRDQEILAIARHDAFSADYAT